MKRRGIIMDNINFTQVTEYEAHLNVVPGTKLTPWGNNMAVYGGGNEVLMFELIQVPDATNMFPYRCSKIEVSSSIPSSKLINQMNLGKVYENCNIQEKQTFTLEAVYMSKYVKELSKPNIKQFAWKKKQHKHDDDVVIVLSTYGYCALYTKSFNSRSWHEKCTLHSAVQNVFPLQTGFKEISTFAEFKSLVDKYFITALTWDASEFRNNIIYTGNAAGDIVALKLTDTVGEFVSVEYAKIHTELGRITYLKSFENFLLIGNDVGAVHLYHVEHNASTALIKAVECLWSRRDRIPVNKAKVQLMPEYKSYLIIFTKAAHVLAYQIGLDGRIICNATHYVGGLSITGLQIYNQREFLVTTIMGNIKLISVDVAESQLVISEQNVASDLDSKHLQILGVAASSNRGVWCFFLHRNCEYACDSKYDENVAFISVCQTNKNDHLFALMNSSIQNMDASLDHLVAMHLEIFKNMNIDKYNDFCALTSNQLLQDINDDMLRIMQVKLHIIRMQLKAQMLKFKISKANTIVMYDFLVLAVQIIHILCRLQYLSNIVKSNGNAKLQPFQQQAVNCMRAKYTLLIAELACQLSNENLQIAELIAQFIAHSGETYNDKCNLPIDDITEVCLVCEEELRMDDMMICTNGHRNKRCCVSFVQLDYFNKRHCSLCQSVALDNDDELRQLLAPHESIKCTFCRLTFDSVEV